MLPLKASYKNLTASSFFSCIYFFVKSTLQRRNRRDVQKIRKMDVAEESSWTSPPQNSEEEQSLQSDNEHQQGEQEESRNETRFNRARLCRTTAMIRLDRETTTKNRPINR